MVIVLLLFLVRLGIGLDCSQFLQASSFLLAPTNHRNSLEMSKDYQKFPFYHLSWKAVHT